MDVPIITNASAAVVWDADYLPFGKVDVRIENGENNLRFAGQYSDGETRLHYNWHRYYDPGLGRYLKADPIGIEGGLNLYHYVSNNPSKYFDALGLKKYTITKEFAGNLLLTPWRGGFDIIMDTTACTATVGTPWVTGNWGFVRPSISGSIIKEDTIGKEDCCKDDGNMGTRVFKQITQLSGTA